MSHTHFVHEQQTKIKNDHLTVNCAKANELFQGPN